MFLARIVLGERLTRAAALRIARIAGAAIVLWPTAPTPPRPAWRSQLPLPRSLADWLGVLGGAAFAFNDVMLRREADQPEEGRALAMFFGGALVAAALAAVLTAHDGRAAAPGRRRRVAVDARLTLVFCGNLALQYGAARLPANQTAVVMLARSCSRRPRR